MLNLFRPRHVRSALALALTLGLLIVAPGNVHAAPKEDQIVVSGTVLDAEGNPVFGLSVSLYRIRSAKAKKGMDSGDAPLKDTETDENGAYKLTYKTKKKGDQYAVLFIVPERESRRGYYSTWASAPNSWENLVIPEDRMIMYWNIAAPESAYFDANPGQHIALGESKLKIGGRLATTLSCPGAKSNKGHVYFRGTSRATDGVTLPQDIPASGKTETALTDNDGKPYATVNLPVGEYEVGYSLNKCPYGKDPVSGYSAIAQVTLKAGETASLSITKKPVKPLTKPKIVGTPQGGKTIKIDPGTWPEGTTVTILSRELDFPKSQKAKIDKYYIGSTIQIIIRAERAGHFAAVYSLKAKVTKGRVTGVPKPKIAGTAKVGKKLTAKPGTWNSKGTKLTYQWQRNGKKITGATKTTYKLSSKDKGSKITLKVTYKKTGYTSVSKTTKATAKVR